MEKIYISASLTFNELLIPQAQLFLSMLVSLYSSPAKIMPQLPCLFLRILLACCSSVLQLPISS